MVPINAKSGVTRRVDGWWRKPRSSMASMASINAIANRSRPDVIFFTAPVRGVKCHSASERSEREFLIDNLLVRINSIIVMNRWTGLAP
jgi:hypothetical protein